MSDASDPRHANPDPTKGHQAAEVPSPAPSCQDRAPAGYTGHWRDWHRGHGCNLDPDRAAAIVTDAARYRRLRVLGVPKATPESEMLRSTDLDAFVDDDIARQCSRGEAHAQQDSEAGASPDADAVRYRRLRVMGVPKATPGSWMMRFTNLDALADAPGPSAAPPAADDSAPAAARIDATEIEQRLAAHKHVVAQARAILQAGSAEGVTAAAQRQMAELAANRKIRIAAEDRAKRAEEQLAKANNAARRSILQPAVRAALRDAADALAAEARNKRATIHHDLFGDELPDRYARGAPPVDLHLTFRQPGQDDVTYRYSRDVEYTDDVLMRLEKLYQSYGNQDTPDDWRALQRAVGELLRAAGWELEVRTSKWRVAELLPGCSPHRHVRWTIDGITKQAYADAHGQFVVGVLHELGTNENWCQFTELTVADLTMFGEYVDDEVFIEVGP